jgi:predicted TIM-barrel fold metal-dependent hydrolase
MTIIDSNTFFGFSPRERVDYSLDALEAMLKSNGVSRAISCSLRGVYYDFKAGNDETLAAAQERLWLIPACTIDPRRHLGCLGEVERMRAAGVKVFRFFPEMQAWPSEHSWPIDSPLMRNLLKEIERLGGVVFLPADEHNAPSQILRLADSLSLSIVLVGVTYLTLAESIACLRIAPNLYLDTQQLVIPMALEVIAGEVGSHRIIFGSREPVRHLQSIINVITYSTLSESEKESILSGNILHLLEAVP